MKHTMTAVALGATAWAAACAAEPSKADADKSATPPVARVEVKAKAEDYDPRRDDTASKTVMTQGEILKYGDTNVFDVLKRAPGVTVAGNSIRMRGLGNGYTQILVNGERPPPGFSLEAVPPDQIERIEIIRAASAEFSMQAIAGTINIVLKKVVSKPQRDGRLALNRADEKQTQYLNGTLADKRGNLSWYLNAGLQHNARDIGYTGGERFTAPDGTVTVLRDGQARTKNSNTVATLAPRLNWKLPNDDQLNLSANVNAQRTGASNDGTLVNVIGGLPAPDFLHDLTRYGNTSVFAGADANWVARLWGGKLDAKLGMSNGRADSTNDLLRATLGDAIRLHRVREDHTRYPRANTSGKYTKSLFDDHLLAAGWEVSREALKTRARLVEGLVGQPPRDVVEHFDPHVLRRAAFAQDEWNVTRQWSMYMGARWEGIRTASSGTGLADTVSNTHVLSPVAQTLYKFPDKSGRQLRLALTHTFRAPDTNQLTARRYQSDVNTRINADSSGNPALKPEQADGADLTYEHFWAPGAVFSLGTSTRRVRDFIRMLLEQESGGRWLYHPVNDGNARVRSVDVELKFPLKAVLKDGAPPIDLRFNLNRNWSSVDTVPGPDNRLDQQTPLSVVVGADYKQAPFGAGVNFAYRKGGPVRVSREQSTLQQTRRDLDAYMQYTPRKDVDLRLSIANALGVGNRNYMRYQDAGGISEEWARVPASPELRFNLNLKF